MTMEELEAVIDNIFAAQGRTVSEKISKVWAREISSKGFFDQAIKQAETELMEEDEERPTLPKVLAVMYKYQEKIRSANFKRIECEWCNGLNYVYATLFFEKNGKYVSDNYAFKCFHNTENNNCAKMVLDPENNNRTETANGYGLIFKNVAERDAYLEKVKLNNWCDLWVKEDFGNKETEVIDDEIIADEDVPDTF